MEWRGCVPGDFEGMGALAPILSQLYGERTGRVTWMCSWKRSDEVALKARGGKHNYTKGCRQQELHACGHTGPSRGVEKPGATGTVAPDIMVFLDHEMDHGYCGQEVSGNSNTGADARLKATIL